MVVSVVSVVSVSSEGCYPGRVSTRDVRDTSAAGWSAGTGGIFELNILGFVLAVVAAVLLIGVAEGVAGTNKSTV